MHLSVRAEAFGHLVKHVFRRHPLVAEKRIEKQEPVLGIRRQKNVGLCQEGHQRQPVGRVLGPSLPDYLRTDPFCGRKAGLAKRFGVVDGFVASIQFGRYLSYHHRIACSSGGRQGHPRTANRKQSRMNSQNRPDVLLAIVAERVQLREGAPGIETFMRAVRQNGPAPLKVIARNARLPIPIATAVRRELESEGLLKREGGVALTAEGEAFLSGALEVVAAPSVVCAHCNGTGLQDPDEAAVASFAALLEDAPRTRVELDQAPCTPATAMRRAALMHRAGAVEGKRILILGDDDSISLALTAYLSAQGAPAPPEIVVLEIDPDRIRFISRHAKAMGGNIDIRAHDLRDPLPEDLCGTFDVFQTDPPYTIEGAKLFLQRALEGLKPGQICKGFLSYGQPAPSDQFALLGMVHALGFAVANIHPDFNAYQGASIIGSSGQMIELSGPFATASPERTRHTGPIYTADLTDRRRIYRCRNCRTSIELGTGGAPRTIEELKSAGCPCCGEKVFERRAGGSERHRRRS